MALRGKKKTSAAFRRRAKAKANARKAKKLRAATSKLRTNLIRLDRGGYDSRGRYYGVGQKIYAVTDKEGDQLAIVRARSASDAKKDVAEQLAVFGEVEKQTWSLGGR